MMNQFCRLFYWYRTIPRVMCDKSTELIEPLSATLSATEYVFMARAHSPSAHLAVSYK